MGRTRCPSCGATVDIAINEETGETVPLEIHTDPSSDTDRYRIVGMNPLKVRLVTKGAPGEYYPTHLYDCPGHNAGR